MECNKRKPVIIEFNGLPGSGKTTIAGIIKNRLEENNYSVCTYYYKARWFRSSRYLFCMPSYWDLIKKTFDYSKHSSFSLDCSRILSFVHFIKMYRDFSINNTFDFLMIDQGLLQAFVSFAHKDILSKTNDLKDLLKAIKIDELPIIFVNCNVEENISNNRIINRPCNGCRVESMSEKDRLETLNIQAKNLSTIRKVVNEIYPGVSFVDLDMENPLDIIAADFLSLVVNNN